jgi:excisionase family DNA binding protein
MALPMRGRPRGSKDRGYGFIWPKDSKDKPRAGGDSLVMTASELCEYLRIHRATLYHLIKRGEIPYFKIGVDYRFHREQIDAWIRQSELGDTHTRATPVLNVDSTRGSRTGAKCRKVLPTGRCTKNAVPGRNLCAVHIRAAEKAASKPRKP